MLLPLLKAVKRTEKLTIVSHSLPRFKARPNLIKSIYCRHGAMPAHCYLKYSLFLQVLQHYQLPCHSSPEVPMCNVSPCLECQGRHLTPLYYFFSCSTAYSHCSFCLFSPSFFFFCILAQSPDLFQKVLQYFSLGQRLLVWILFS